MTRNELIANIQKKRSFLCIGLDPVLSMLPQHLLDEENPVLTFNKAIIDATEDLCVAYKPNSAFYECLGESGWQTLHDTRHHIPADIFSIADAKRGDIGNTSKMYGDAFLSKDAKLDFDAITVAPYMGYDSITPFLHYPDKWVILLALTSNPGFKDFQLLTDGHKHVYEQVIEKSEAWASIDQMMYVVGATHPAEFNNIRRIAPDHFLLVPGIGAQGGNLREVCAAGLNDDCGLLINVGRSILYADSGKNFAEAARAEALKVQQEMDDILSAAGI